MCFVKGNKCLEETQHSLRSFLHHFLCIFHHIYLNILGSSSLWHCLEGILQGSAIQSIFPLESKDSCLARSSAHGQEMSMHILINLPIILLNMSYWYFHRGSYKKQFSQFSSMIKTLFCPLRNLITCTLPMRIMLKFLFGFSCKNLHSQI